MAGSSDQRGMGGGMGGERSSGTFPGGTSTGTTGSTVAGTGTDNGAAPTGGTGGGSTTTNAALTTLLDNTTSRWSAAVVGDQSAAGYILSTDTAVMAIGGWSGSDASPTLAQFQAYVAAGEIRYFIAGGSQGGAGGQGSTTSSASAITAWVTAHYSTTTVGGATAYDLSTATS